MSIKVEVQMTVKIMYQFLVYHNYTSLNGIFGVFLGIMFAYIGVSSIGEAELLLVGLFFVFAMYKIVGTPFTIYSRAKSTVEKSEAFRHPTVYELTETGILVGQMNGTDEIETVEVPWKNVMKVTTTTGLVLVYVTKLQALILPKVAFGENYTTAVKMISTHVPPSKVKFRTMA